MVTRWFSGLRGKFVGALIVSSVLPLLIGIIVLQTIGFEHLLSERGRIHETEARALSNGLDQAVVGLAGKLKAWVEAGPVAVSAAAASSRAGEQMEKAALEEQIARIEALWPTASEDAPEIRAVLENETARNMGTFQASSPEVAEIIVTDVHGRLIAATGRTSDYDQSDEAWWQKGIALPKDGCWTDSLHFDRSAEVYSIDLVIPLVGSSGNVGVVKMVLKVSPLFNRVGTHRRPDERVEVVLTDGTIIARPGWHGDAAGELVLDPEAMLVLRIGRIGWTILKDDQGESWMTGFSAIQSSLENRRDHEAGGYVLFASPKNSVVAPVRQQLMWVALAAGIGVMGCAMTGYWLVLRGILRPLGTLRNASKAVAGSAKLHLGSGTARMAVEVARKEAETDLARIKGIHTGDEIEALASDVGVMTSRVLRYQREMEAEVEAKTSVIQNDLEMAREFQHALLPSDYPEVPASAHHRLRLGFSHYYEPASTVGGDFFDLMELEDGRVGVLIADVMGHGARSALVTAILRALVRNHSAELTDPGQFLQTLNHHLYEVISRSGQSLFVSAFFMVLDTGREELSWAVAGHPAPVRAKRGSGRPPDLLWRGAHHQAALGLIEDASYESHTDALRAGEVFLLYTDGLIEAENAAGEDFGLKRLLKAVDLALDGPMAAMPAQIVCQASAFRKSDRYDDDVCVVAVEVVPNQPIEGGSPADSRRTEASRT